MSIIIIIMIIVCKTSHGLDRAGIDWRARAPHCAHRNALRIRRMAYYRCALVSRAKRKAFGACAVHTSTQWISLTLHYRHMAPNESACRTAGPTDA